MKDHMDKNQSLEARIDALDAKMISLQSLITQP